MTIFESYLLTEFNTLMEIPVYRVSPDAFEKELEKELDRIGTPLAVFKQLFPADYLERKNAQRSELKLHIGYPWKFNEIVGWVMLNIDRDIFSGELFYREGKRTVKGSKQKIHYRGEAFRLEVNPYMNNKQIYAAILTELRALTKKGATKGRFIDTHRFEALGKYINWKKMFGDMNS